MVDTRYEVEVDVKIDPTTRAALARIERDVKRVNRSQRDLARDADDVEQGFRRGARGVREFNQEIERTGRRGRRDPTGRGLAQSVKSTVEESRRLRAQLEQTNSATGRMNASVRRATQEFRKMGRIGSGQLDNLTKRAARLSSELARFRAGRIVSGDGLGRLPLGRDGRGGVAVGGIGGRGPGGGALVPRGTVALTRQQRALRAIRDETDSGAGSFRRWGAASSQAFSGAGRFNVQVNRLTQNLRIYNRTLRDGERAARRSARAFRIFGAIGVTGLFFQLRALTRVARGAFDSFTQMRNQIQVSTGTVQEFNTVMDGLFDISSRTGVQVEGLAKIYQRFRLTTRGMGIEQSKLIQFTETLTKTVAAFGIGAEEARGAMIQFTQGLGGNRLSGQELNAVLEQLPPLAQAIAEELGVTTGSLRKLANEMGAIDAEVAIAGLERLRLTAGRAFDQTTRTTQQFGQILVTQLARAVGAVSEAFGGTGGLNDIVALTVRYVDDFIRQIREGTHPISDVIALVREWVGNMQTLNNILLLIDHGFRIAAAGIAFFSKGIEFASGLIAPFAELLDRLRRSSASIQVERQTLALDLNEAALDLRDAEEALRRLAGGTGTGGISRAFGDLRNLSQEDLRELNEALTEAKEAVDEFRIAGKRAVAEGIFSQDFIDSLSLGDTAEQITKLDNAFSRLFNRIKEFTDRRLNILRGLQSELPSVTQGVEKLRDTLQDLFVGVGIQSQDTFLKGLRDINKSAADFNKRLIEAEQNAAKIAQREGLGVAREQFLLPDFERDVGEGAIKALSESEKVVNRITSGQIRGADRQVEAAEEVLRILREQERQVRQALTLVPDDSPLRDYLDLLQGRIEEINNVRFLPIAKLETQFRSIAEEVQNFREFDQLFTGAELRRGLESNIQGLRELERLAIRIGSPALQKRVERLLQSIAEGTPGLDRDLFRARVKEQLQNFETNVQRNTLFSRAASTLENITPFDPVVFSTEERLRVAQQNIAFYERERRELFKLAQESIERGIQPTGEAQEQLRNALDTANENLRATLANERRLAENQLTERQRVIREFFNTRQLNRREYLSQLESVIARIRTERLNRNDQTFAAGTLREAERERGIIRLQLQIEANTREAQLRIHDLARTLSDGLGGALSAAIQGFHGLNTEAGQFAGAAVQGFTQAVGALVEYRQEVTRANQVFAQSEQDAAARAAQQGAIDAAQTGLIVGGIGAALNLTAQVINTHFQEEARRAEERRREEEAFRQHQFRLLESASNQRNEMIVLQRRQVFEMEALKVSLDEANRRAEEERRARQAAQLREFAIRQAAAFNAGAGGGLGGVLPSTLTVTASRAEGGGGSPVFRPVINNNVAVLRTEDELNEWAASQSGAVSIVNGLNNNPEITRPVLGFG